jgi:3-mercaptopyruvate sulfurtransferase SseA
MHRKASTLLLAGLVAGLLATPLVAQNRSAAVVAEPGPPRISQAEFKQLLAGKGIIVVDTRTEESFRDGHIPGALLLPFEGRTSMPPGSDTLVDQLKASKQPIVIYCGCHGESTSIRVATILQLRGVPDVRILVGGWSDWINDQNPVEESK